MRADNQNERRGNHKGNGAGNATGTWDVLTAREKGEKRFFTKIGVAFKNDSGSFRVLLDALPLDGTLLIMPPK